MSAEESFVCDLCEHLITDGTLSEHCDGCGRRWCVQHPDIESFGYNGEIRCDICFPTTPLPITTDVLLKRALELLGMTEGRLREEILMFDSVFSEPQNVYECFEEHLCGNNDCEDIDLSYPDTTFAAGNTQRSRGKCCVTLDPNNWNRWCDPCREAVGMKKRKQNWTKK